MKKILTSIGVFMLAGGALLAQNSQAEGHWPVSLGLKVGVPVTDMFSTGSSAGPNPSTNVFSSSVPRYEIGASGEFHLPFHLRFEVDGLYKPGGFNGSLLNDGGYLRTRFNQWEIPGLFKYNVSLGHFRPFIDFGASYRHISTIDERTSFGGGSLAYNDNSFALTNRNSFGGVAGFGMTFKKGLFELTPEARYTRWADGAFSAPGLKSNKDQGDVLLGITF